MRSEETAAGWTTHPLEPGRRHSGRQTGSHRTGCLQLHQSRTTVWVYKQISAKHQGPGQGRRARKKTGEGKCGTQETRNHTHRMERCTQAGRRSWTRRRRAAGRRTLVHHTLVHRTLVHRTQGARRRMWSLAHQRCHLAHQRCCLVHRSRAPHQTWTSEGPFRQVCHPINQSTHQ